MKYNVLIVDDEFLARKLLAGYIEKMDGFEVVGCCANAFEAFARIKETRVDILLLDIHMPELSGMEFVKTCTDIPAVIFTTAYSKYALDSYEVNATDYLLKPIALPRFMQAMEKAVARVKATLPQLFPATPPLLSAGKEKSLPHPPLRGQAFCDENVSPSPALGENWGEATYLIVKADYKLYKINYDDLLYIEGQHEYVSFYTTGKRITALYSLKSLEETLPPDRFIRVHKSYIVSIREISEIEPTNVIVAGKRIPVGGNYKDTLIAALQPKA